MVAASKILPLPIADYALIGDCRSAALVGRNGSIDWLCWPRFDSAACFAALLGTADHGRWFLRPTAGDSRVERSYRGDTLMLETRHETESGRCTVLDFMAVHKGPPTLVRLVRGVAGSVPMRMDMTIRFDFGSSVPWVTKLPNGEGISAIAGPNLCVLRAPVKLRGEDLSTVADFTVEEGEEVAFVLSYGPSYQEPPRALQTSALAPATGDFWTRWAKRCTYQGEHRAIVLRSLLTLKALTFSATGGIVAAPTTSLPERPGGPRNWDYRYCWIRDATLTLAALMGAGYYDEAKAWRDWLHRSLAGTPDDLQIMYGIAGERRLAEWEVPWLPGYHGASPVRIGNAASDQLQLDVWGEMMDALHLARKGGLAAQASAWILQCTALGHLEKIWREPDEGIWETRGGRRQFTYSKIMAWVAFDRSIRDAEEFGLKAPVDRWRQVREEIHREVCEKGFNLDTNAFTQSFGSAELDASLLLIPQVGFLPIGDSRVEGTIAAIEHELVEDGFVRRYRTTHVEDGLSAGEGVFLEAMLKRLLSVANDVGLFSEEFDPRNHQLLGNFPQAFSHLALVQTVLGLAQAQPLRDRLRETTHSQRKHPNNG